MVVGGFGGGVLPPTTRKIKNRIDQCFGETRQRPQEHLFRVDRQEVGGPLVKLKGAGVMGVFGGIVHFACPSSSAGYNTNGPSAYKGAMYILTIKYLFLGRFFPQI